MTDLATEPHADKSSEDKPIGESVDPTDRELDLDAEGDIFDDGHIEAFDADETFEVDDTSADDAEVADAEPEDVVAEEAEPESRGSADDAEPADAGDETGTAGATPEVADPADDADVEPSGTTDEDAATATDGSPETEALAPETPETEDDADVEPEASVAEVGPDAPTALIAPAYDAPTIAGAAVDAPTAVVATTATLSPATETAPTDAGAPAFAWAPPEPKPKKKHTAVWISAAAAVAVVGLVASSLVLIAPGTSVAGVPIGWMTPGAAAEAIDQRLAETTVVIAGEDGEVEVTGAELGATVDAQALAEAAFAEHPMWNPTAWFAPPVEAAVELDPVAATEALRAAMPDVYTDPIDAEVAFDPASASYVTTPATLGTGIDVATVQSALQEAFEAGETSIEIDPVIADVPAGIPTEVADATVAQLNGMLDTVGFYVGEERTVPVDRAVAASWLTVTPGDGEFEITADAAAIQPVVDTLAPAVNRAPENARAITDSAGKVLREESAGQTGRELGDTSDVASDFATQLADGNAAFALPVTEVPVTTVSIARRIEVDLGAQRTYLFENGNVVESYAISSGLASSPTPTGNFRVFAHVSMQDMGLACSDPTRTDSYCTEDVPWVTYFAPDIAFHGAYWHNNFGNPMSHGCVNMPINVAKFVYDWAPAGTEVWVHG